MSRQRSFQYTERQIKNAARVGFVKGIRVIREQALTISAVVGLGLYLPAFALGTISEGCREVFWDLGNLMWATIAIVFSAIAVSFIIEFMLSLDNQ